jgi:hypothetical protein
MRAACRMIQANSPIMIKMTGITNAAAVKAITSTLMPRPCAP